MRVAIITTSWGEPWSEGVRNLARSLNEYLTGAGDDVRVIHPALENGQTETHRNHPTWWYAQSGARFLMQAARTLRADRADAAFWFTSLSSWFGLKQRFLTTGKTPVVPFITGQRASVAGYAQFAQKSPTLVITPYFQQRYLPHAVFVPPFLPVNVRRPESFVRRAPTPPYQILFLGSFEAARGVESLLEAVSRLDDRFHLTLAWNGVGAGRRDIILRTIEQLGVGARVRLLREVDVSAACAEADVLVIPRLKSTKMAFPVRILEAAHMRLPMVVSTMVGMNQVVGDAGSAFPPGDSRALAERLHELLTDPQRYAAAVAGCETLEHRYSPNRSLETVREVLRNVAA